MNVLVMLVFISILCFKIKSLKLIQHEYCIGPRAYLSDCLLFYLLV